MLPTAIFRRPSDSGSYTIPRTLGNEFSQYIELRYHTDQKNLLDTKWTMTETLWSRYNFSLVTRPYLQRLPHEFVFPFSNLMEITYSLYIMAPLHWFYLTCPQKKLLPSDLQILQLCFSPYYYFTKQMSSSTQYSIFPCNNHCHTNASSNQVSIYATSQA